MLRIIIRKNDATLMDIPLATLVARTARPYRIAEPYEIVVHDDLGYSMMDEIVEPPKDDDV